LDKFLRARSLSFEKFRERITGGEQWNRDVFSERVKSRGFCTDFRDFRRFPLMDLQDGNHLVIDLQFLEELLITAPLFQLLNQLNPTEGKTLLDLWGRVFELLLMSFSNISIQMTAHR
jgi:hypothetical protein